MKIEWVKFCLIVVVNFINEMAAISNDDCPFAMNGWMMSIINSYSIFIQTNGEKQRFYCQILSRDLAFIFYISAILIWYWIWDFHHHFRRMMMMKIWMQTTINEYFFKQKNCDDYLQIENIFSFVDMFITLLHHHQYHMIISTISFILCLVAKIIIETNITIEVTGDLLN